MTSAYTINTRTQTKCHLERRDVVIEAEFYRDGDFRISRRREDGNWSYVIVPHELMDDLLAYYAKGGEL